MKARPLSPFALWLAPTQCSRRRLLIAWILLLLWVSVLITLYLTTRTPHESAPTPRGFAAGVAPPACVG
jgi:hypothetical protein